MSAPYSLLGISGSIRSNSYSTAILKALAEASKSHADFEFADIGALPHFNQDLVSEGFPENVQIFRDLIERADGIVVVSPEYNHGIPGVLKNAFDWASRPHNASPLKNKPILIVTSSPAVTGGVRAQYQIRETIVSSMARPVNTPEIVIGSVGSKMTGDCFSDATSIEFAMNGFEALYTQISKI